MTKLVSKTIIFLLLISFTNAVQSQTRIEKEYYKDGQLSKVTEYVKLGGNKEQVTIKDIFYGTNKVSKTTIYFTINGKIDGLYKEYDFTRLSSTTNYKDGKKNGEYVEYDLDGDIESQGNYVNDEEEGMWRYYYSVGKLWKFGMYVNGKQDGEWTYYEKNGKVSSNGSYAKGEKNGIWRTYFEDGSLESVKKFINGKEDTSYVSTEAVNNPCPNLKKLENICMNLPGRTMDPKPKGDYVYMYQRKLLDAACVEVDKDSEEVIAKKIQIMWNAAHAQKKLSCFGIQFDVSGGNLLKYAVSTTFDEFIDDAIWWKVNLNYIDDIDKRTVLDYIQYQIEKNKGKNIVSRLQHYYKILREAGAKHAAELK